jgi:hypothetical protein
MAAPACIDRPAAPGCFTMLKTLIIATMLLPRLAIAHQSQQVPQPRQPGQWCPAGWVASGNYCVPGSDKAPQAERRLAHCSLISRDLFSAAPLLSRTCGTMLTRAVFSEGDAPAQ